MPYAFSRTISDVLCTFKRFHNFIFHQSARWVYLGPGVKVGNLFWSARNNYLNIVYILVPKWNIEMYYTLVPEWIFKYVIPSFLNEYLNMLYLHSWMNIYLAPHRGRARYCNAHVCLFVCVCVCVFVRVFAKFQSVISQSFLNRSSWNLTYTLSMGTLWLTNIFRILGQRSRS